MNPGVTEEIGKAAESTIDALKSTPVVLALVIFNVLYMAGSFWSQNQMSETYDRGAERWKSLTETAMRYCNVQPQASVPGPGMKLQSDESRPEVRPEESKKEEGDGR